MNIIKKALDEVRYEIPREILEQTFIDPELKRRGVAVSMDTMILQHVIEPRVKTDCNLVGGIQVMIPLGNVMPEFIDQTAMIYRIPKSLTQGRSITTALSISFGDVSLMTGTNVGYNHGSALMSAAQGVLASEMPIDNVSTAYVQLIGENTVLVSENYALPANTFLRCILENDENFTHIRPQSYHDFCILVKLAVKAYIYTNLSIKMDVAQLHGGMALGRMKEFVDSYADANELYHTHLQDVWRKVSFMNDPESMRRHLKMAMGGAH